MLLKTLQRPPCCGTCNHSPTKNSGEILQVSGWCEIKKQEEVMCYVPVCKTHLWSILYLTHLSFPDWKMSSAEKHSRVTDTSCGTGIGAFLGGFPQFLLGIFVLLTSHRFLCNRLAFYSLAHGEAELMETLKKCYLSIWLWLMLLKWKVFNFIKNAETHGINMAESWDI